MPPGRDPLRRGELERHRHRLDLRRPRHVQEVQGPDPGRHRAGVRARRPRVHARRAAGRLAAGLPARSPRRPGGRGAAADHPAEGGHRRRRPAGDPAPGGAEAVPGAGRAVAVRPAAPTSSGCWPRSTTWSCGSTSTSARPRPDAARGRLQGHRRGRRRRADRRRRPATPPAGCYGIAFDLGTTTVVATLLDLTTGTPLAVASMLNKQQPFGADVITRISATMLDPARLWPAGRPGAGDAGRAGRRGVRPGRRGPGGRAARSRWPATPR